MANREAIAITGIGCRFPGGVTGPESFWRLLSSGRDAITEVPADRWHTSRYFHPEPGLPGKTYARWGGFVDGIDQFDPQFFGISPREAASIDPQQRLLLETVWEALEDAGQVIDDVLGADTGVFVGISHHDYAFLQVGGGERRAIGVYTPTGTAHSIAANRISYCLNLRGPSIAVDTACSSSLTAVHLACESLWRGECRLALAGGVNVIISPDAYIGFSQCAMLSPDGRCRAFDAHANGFVRAEGAGMVVLKPLPAAIAARDEVYAVILGTAVNQDGHTPGLTVPGQSAQEALVRAACRSAGVAPQEVDYVEAHGTGTPVGDPIEARALGAVLAPGRQPDQPCIIGSVKTNVGHLESASGIAGLIKVALMLRHNTIPPHLHFSEANPNIPLADLKLRVPLGVEPFPARGRQRLAGVNSFGFGGANAHVMLAESPPAAASRETTPGDAEHHLRVLALSARSVPALESLARAWQTFLVTGDGAATAWRDLTYTASVRRHHHEQRLAIVAASGADAAEKLSVFLKGERGPDIRVGQRPPGGCPKIAFVFSGQGPQWIAMGRELTATEPVFRDTIVACDTLFRQLGDWSLCAELAAEEGRSRLQETAIAQPAIFAIQMALTALWQSWGIRPDAVVGHSVGEVAAAAVAGVLDFSDAARVVFHRGRCMQAASTKGKMLAAEVTAAEAEQWRAGCRDRVFLAAVNSPNSVTFSGEAAAILSLRDAMEGQGVSCRLVPVEYAFHSPYMEPAAGRVVDALRGLAARPGTIPIVSTVTGRLADGAQCGAEHWGESVRQPVQFAAAVDALIQQRHDLFVELSPHPVLAGAIGACLAHRGELGTVLASMRRKEPERATMLSALGALYARGLPVAWERLFADGGRCVRLPTYPWQRASYWSEAEESRQPRLAPQVHPLLGSVVPTADPCWQTRPQARLLPYLNDHRVDSHLIFPAAAYLEMARAAAGEIAGGPSCVLENVEFRQAMLLPAEGDDLSVELRYSSHDRTFTVASRNGGENTSWTENCRGTVGQMRTAVNSSLVGEALSTEGYEELSVAAHYARRRRLGLEFGPAFQTVRRLWHKSGEAISQLQLDAREAGEAERYAIHPALLDGCFQTLSAAVAVDVDGPSRPLFLPVRVRRIRFFSRAPTQAWAQARLRRVHARQIEGDLRLYDAHGNLLVEIDGFCCQAVESRRQADGAFDDWLYELQWQLLPPSAAASRLAADDLPAGREIRETVGKRSALAIAQGGSVDRYPAVASQVDELCRGYIVRVLVELGWRLRLGERFAATDLQQQLGIAGKYGRLLPHYLSLLSAGGLVRKLGADWEVIGQEPACDLPALWRSILAEFPAFHPELTLLAKCGQHLAAILNGGLDPLPLLFGGSAAATVEHLYRDSWSFGRYHRMLADAVALASKRLPAGRRLRILEIGGGTGGLTAHVLGRLPADRAEYVFTDLSKHFCTHAEQQFREYPFLRCAAMDLELPPADQGFPSHEFDIVLASDVLHAVAELRPALEHVRQLLAPGGLFLFLELVKSFTYVDLLFGVLDGWWRFRDADLRQSQPFLSRARWETLLSETGFGDVTSIAEPGRPEAETGHVVFAARAPQSTAAAGHRAPSPAAAPGRWLIVTDAGGVAAALAARLERRGAEVVFANPAEDLHESVRGPSSQRPWRGIVHLGSLRAASGARISADRLDDAQRQGCYSVLGLVQALTAGPLDPPPPLWLVTRGTQPVPATDGPIAVAQSPLCGLARVLMNEHPEFCCRLIDLAPSSDVGEVAALERELWEPDEETEIALRGEGRYVARLTRKPWTMFRAGAGGGAQAKQEGYRLCLPRAGTLEGLDWSATTRRSPGRGEVEIEVTAAALNFRDVMKTLGIYPTEADDAHLLGDECAGRIVAVGEEVADLYPGQEVLALGAGCFASHVVTPAAFVLPKPAHLSAEEAATIPVCYLTALYALRRVGRIAAGERVLIHAAAGGVGLAAVHLARHFGAEVFATAGSPEKRDFLRQLGVEYVFDSRSLDFADEIAAATAGEGVDVVLNSLAGEAIPKGLSLLRPHGRFLELGKRDIYQDARLGLGPMRNNLTFAAIDLGQTMATRPGVVRSMLRTLGRLLTSRRLGPLPLRAVAAGEVRSAFRQMAQGRHLGKLVVLMHQPHAPAHRLPNERPLRLAADASYLISGGLGGFGLAVAAWLVARGARHVVLASRSGVPAASDLPTLERLRATGAHVVAMRADISRAADVAQLFDEIDRALPPLRGVIHAAMVLDDGALRHLDNDRFARVLAPKMHGAWNLHRQTETRPLDFFVLFSSAAAIVGNPGQANYAAANAFLDALAHARRAQGLPGLSINWGLLGEVGYVARRPEIADFLARQGLVGFSPDQALEVLDRLLRTDAAQVTALQVDWQKWAEFFPRLYRAPRYERVFAGQTPQAETDAAATTVPDILRAANPGERLALLTSFLQQQAAAVLRIDPKEIDVARPLGELGLDSLMAVELLNRIESKLQLPARVGRLLSGITIAVMARETLEAFDHPRSGGAGPSAAAPAAVTAATASPGELAEQLDRLSDAEVDKLLRERLIDAALAPALGAEAGR